MNNTSEPRLEGLCGLKGPSDASWGLSPSDFAILRDNCRRCFYLKVARKQPRPASPFPSVFGRIDRAMKEFYLGERADEMAPGMPAGVIGGGDRWLKSSQLTLPNHEGACVIRGRVDVLVDGDDGTKGIVDFKTTVPKPDHIATYSRQLHAYATALEHPSSGRLQQVSSLGLLCFFPSNYEAEAGRADLSGHVEWIEVPRDDKGFSDFLGEVLDVLARPDPPPAAPGCAWCKRQVGLDAVA